MSRQIILDTETTGLDPKKGHRLIEIGAIEMVNRRLTGNTFHVYLNPQRAVDLGALAIHGLNDAFLADKPLFTQILPDLLNYITDAELIIHNASFDLGFIEHELHLAQAEIKKIAQICCVTDTLLLARRMHPGQKNSLDALCKRYRIDNSHRSLHGALLDAQILSQVYLAMTGGQTSLLDNAFASTSVDPSLKQVAAVSTKNNADWYHPVVFATTEELVAHTEFLSFLAKKSKGSCLWDSLMADSLQDAPMES